MAGNDGQVANAPAGFWKIRHAVIGLGVVALIVLLVGRGCSGESEDETASSASGDKAVPKQAIVVQIPGSQWPGQHYAPAQPPYPSTGYPQQQPAYGVPAQPYGQQQPAYGVPAQPYAQQQPAYGVPVQPYTQQQPSYGVPAQPGYSAPAANNPWTMQQQAPAYGYGGQYLPVQPQQGMQQAPQWGRPQREQPVYTQPPGTLQYRPLDEQSSAAQQSRPAQPVVRGGWPSAPYDHLSGSSFGATPGGWSGYPYSGGYPGYYGGVPYALPGGYTGWPGVTGYPGAGWPLGW